MELTARIHREDDGYWAEVVDLPGCFASGDTLDELAEALSEAISLYLTDNPDAAQVSADELRSLALGEMKFAVPA